MNLDLVSFPTETRGWGGEEESSSLRFLPVSVWARLVFPSWGAQHCLLVTWKVHLCIFKAVVHTSVRHDACAGE